MKKGMTLEEARSLVGKKVRVRWGTSSFERGPCPQCGSTERPEAIMHEKEHEAEGELQIGTWEINDRFLFLEVGEEQHVDTLEGDETAFEFVEWEVIE